MVDNYLMKIGGAPTPSARKSIHSHIDCPFSPFNMGRHGLIKHNINQRGVNSSPNGQGEDEVDNVMSKPVKPSSPLPLKNNYLNRRKSLSPQNVSETEDSDSNVTLAKSLPATLPSYCSDELGYSNHSNNINWTSHDAMHMRDTTRLEWSTNGDNSFGSQNNRSVSFQDISRNEEKKNSKLPALLVSVIVAIIAAGVYLKDNMNLLSIAQGTNSIVYDELKFYADINNLRRKYKVTDDTILKVQSGISTIYKNQDTGSFIFVYNSKSNNFNPMELDKFMNDVAATSAQYLRNDSMPVQHTTVDSSSLNMHTYNELIKRYQHDVDKSGVMLITEMDRVPSSLAMAFHYYCDEYNPIVKKSAIFFTLNLARCSNMSDQLSKHALIEKCLEKKWYSDVPQENMAPLLNRVVNVVIDVTGVRLKEP